jgi:hypothetical protein
MALISFNEWRGQRGEAGPHDKRKSGGRPKGTWVGGNPRFGRSRGNDNFANRKNTRSWLKQQDQNLADDIGDEETTS